MIITLITTLIHLALTAIVAAALISVLSSKFVSLRSNLTAIPFIIILLAVQELLWIPSMNELDVSIVIGNESIAKLIGNNVHITKLMTPSGFGAFTWFLQAIFGFWAIDKLSKDNTKEESE